MREKPKDNERLLHMLEAIDNIFEFVNGKSFEVYKSDKILRFAVIKNLEIIGTLATLRVTRQASAHESATAHPLPASIKNIVQRIEHLFNANNATII